MTEAHSSIDPAGSVETGKRVVAIARRFIGTPYRHQGTRLGVGCDCLGLIRGVWREIYGSEPENPPPYGKDWAERAGQERLRDAALRNFGASFPFAEARPGDVLLFRFRHDCAAKHLGILSSPGRFIHAYERVGVIESPLVFSWQARIAGVFRFPAIKGDI